MDVCDCNCPARASTQWWKADGRLTLTTCDHHGREMSDQLQARGFRAIPALEADAHDGAN